MKLIFLYGAPAVGKLTVAQELAKLTDFRVFHNHLTIDCIEPVFDFGTPSFSRLINLIRLETVAEAARAHVNLIFTYCYAKDFDDAHVAEFAKTIEANGGEICFVLLTCERGELERRVLEESRKQYSKAQNTEILGEILGKYDLSSPVPQRESLLIDNTNLSAAEAAQKIVEHFRFN